MLPNSSLRQTTRGLIAAVEAQTGKQVIVQEDPGIQTFANVSIARGGAPAHVIRYKPVSPDEPDYLICYQCGFVLRKYGVPTDEMIDFGSTEVGSSITAALLGNAQGKKHRLDPEQIRMASKQMVDGLLVHLLSVPVGLRVGMWLRQEYPDLIALQDRQIVREVNLNKRTNTTEIKRRIPKKIFDATQTLNAAFAFFWADIVNQPDLVEPFDNYRKEAQELIDILNGASPDPKNDRDLIDAWADRLNLSEWYQWVPFQA